MKLAEIARLINGQLHGPADLKITGPAKIEEATAGEITFVSNSRYLKFLNQTKASAVIVGHDVKDVELPHIRVENPYMGFLLVLRLFDPGLQKDFEGISEKAFIHAEAVLGEGCSVAPGAYISAGVRLGKNCIVFPGVVLGPNVETGDDCILYPLVSIRENCRLGSRVIIHNGAVIGSDGFGFAPYGAQYHKIPQLGNVVLEDDVEIGANCAIDRATTGSTTIKKGSKIDNLVQIAHNCVVGSHTVIAAQTGMAGSTEIGNWVTIGGQVGISGHIKVGDKAVIAAKSGITNSVPDGRTMFGYPALPVQKMRRVQASLRHLPEKSKEINALRQEVEALKKALKKQGLEIDESNASND